MQIVAMSTPKAIAAPKEPCEEDSSFQLTPTDLPTKLAKVSLHSGSASLFQDLWTDLIVDVMRSYNESKLLHAVKACRHLLDFYADDPPIDMLISKGIISRCIDLLSMHNNPNIQFEALWSLANVTAGTSEQTLYVANNRAIPKLVELLKSPITDIFELAAWTLGNIAGDGPEGRDKVLQHNVMPLLLDLIKPTTSVPFTRNMIRTIANICRNDRAPPPFEVVRMALPTLNQLLRRDDPDISADASRALLELNDTAEGWLEGLQNTLEEFQLFFSIIFYGVIFYVFIMSCFEKVSLPESIGNSTDAGARFVGLAEIMGVGDILRESSHIEL